MSLFFALLDHIRNVVLLALLQVPFLFTPVSFPRPLRLV